MQSPIHILSVLFNSTGSLEKILKLAQAIAQVVAALHWDGEMVKRWDGARGNLALGKLGCLSFRFVILPWI